MCPENYENRGRVRGPIGLLLVGALSACASTSAVISPIPETLEISSGQLESFQTAASSLIGQRRIFVWRPKDYSQNKRYDVLYMHDGQMLFDDQVTWNGQEWGVDEVASQLIESGQTRDFIVVAVDHAGSGEGRWAEYFPQKARLLTSGLPTQHHLFSLNLSADRYLRFLVEELQPFINSRYAVNVGVQHNFLAGSSMGGLISLYALSEYPDAFAGAACLSTHWPGTKVEDPAMPAISEALLDYFEKNLPAPGRHRIYFDHGTETLDAHYPALQKRVDQLMRDKGYDQAHWQTQVFEGHAHDENSWRARLSVPLLFLLGTEQGGALVGE